jgi:single-strand DNA-binding protein
MLILIVFLRMVFQKKGGKDMINTIVLVGRVVSDPVLGKMESGNSYTHLTLAVTRSYKNVKGEYDTDFIPCTVWYALADSCVLYCKKGDIVGIRGRLQMRQVDLVFSKEKTELKRKVNQLEIIAEHVAYIHSGSRKKEDKNTSVTTESKESVSYREEDTSDDDLPSGV